MDDEYCCKLTRQRDSFEAMFAKDQFWTEFNQHNYLPELEEAQITFPPTYKFAKGSTEYALDKRPPAWYLIKNLVFK